MKKLLAISIASGSIAIGAIPALTNQTKAQNLKLVYEGLTYKGVKMLPDTYIDVDSAMLTVDDYIVFRSGSLGEDRRLESIQYEGIGCKTKRWITSKGLPKFKTEWRDYTKNEDTWDNSWPRNVEKMLCRRSGIRSIPHTAGEVLFLNYSSNKGLNFSPLQYDEAVDLGLIK